MKRTVAVMVLAALIALPIAAVPHEMSHHQKTVTLTGEVVDTGCYLGHAARGAKHVDCANRCLSGGMPMGLLTSQGTVYLITMNHDNPDAYNKLKTMAGKTVTVTGTLITRGGMKGIDVTSFRKAKS